MARRVRAVVDSSPLACGCPLNMRQEALDCNQIAVEMLSEPETKRKFCMIFDSFTHYSISRIVPSVWKKGQDNERGSKTGAVFLEWSM